MKCLLCNFVSNESEDLKERHINFRKVDEDSQFFINLFKRQNNVFRPRKCLRCDRFLFNHWVRVNHDFLVDYGADRDVSDEKTVHYTRPGEIKKYKFTFVQHLQDYAFYSSEKLVEDFLFSVNSR